MFAVGPKAKSNVRKQPFGLSLSKPLSPLFGLSLSKTVACGKKASTGSARPFDKLRANGGGEQANANRGENPTLVNSRNRPRADARFTRRVSRAARWRR
jgi:hypothetical protein